MPILKLAILKCRENIRSARRKTKLTKNLLRFFFNSRFLLIFFRCLGIAIARRRFFCRFCWCRNCIFFILLKNGNRLFSCRILSCRIFPLIRSHDILNIILINILTIWTNFHCKRHIIKQFRSWAIGCLIDHSRYSSILSKVSIFRKILSRFWSFCKSYRSCWLRTILEFSFLIRTHTIIDLSDFLCFCSHNSKIIIFIINLIHGINRSFRNIFDIILNVFNGLHSPII